MAAKRTLYSQYAPSMRTSLAYDFCPSPHTSSRESKRRYVTKVQTRRKSLPFVNLFILLAKCYILFDCLISSLELQKNKKSLTCLKYFYAFSLFCKNICYVDYFFYLQ